MDLRAVDTAAVRDGLIQAAELGDLEGLAPDSALLYRSFDESASSVKARPEKGAACGGPSRGSFVEPEGKNGGVGCVRVRRDLGVYSITLVIRIGFSLLPPAPDCRPRLLPGESESFCRSGFSRSFSSWRTGGREGKVNAS